MNHTILPKERNLEVIPSRHERTPDVIRHREKADHNIIEMTSVKRHEDKG